MALEELRDKLQDQLVELRGRIEESPAYNSLRERYENLSPNAQRGLLIGLGTAVLLFFCYIPYSYFSSSGNYVTEFNEKRSLVRQLLRASRLASQAGSVQNPPDLGTLQASISTRLMSFNLLPEQNAGVNPVDAASLGGSLAPPGIVQEGLAVNLKQLNLKQVVDIGYSFQTLAQGVRLIGISMLPTQKDTRYFDVVYQIVRYSMPGVSSGEGLPEGNAPNGAGGRRGGANRATGGGSAAPSRPRFSPPPSQNNQQMQNDGGNVDSGPAPDGLNPFPSGERVNQEGPIPEDEQLGDPDEFEGE